VVRGHKDANIRGDKNEKINEIIFRVIVRSL